MPKVLPPEIHADAWVGDAVLSLFVREWILRESGKTDGEELIALTSNRFLATMGNPTEIEATIGRIYRSEGIQAAFNWIGENVLPMYLAQRKRRKT